MAMVNAVYWLPTCGPMGQAEGFGHSKGRLPPGAALHSSREPDELWQCCKYDNSIIKIILVLLPRNGL